MHGIHMHTRHACQSDTYVSSGAFVRGGYHIIQDKSTCTRHYMPKPKPVHRKLGAAKACATHALLERAVELMAAQVTIIATAVKITAGQEILAGYLHLYFIQGTQMQKAG